MTSKPTMKIICYLALVLPLLVLHFAAADYELHVTVNAFELRDQRCAICNDDEDLTITNNQCCDGELETTSENPQCTLQCDVYFNFCQYPLDTPIINTSIGCSSALQTFSTPDFIFNIANRTFSPEDEMFLGLTNPIVFSGLLWEGVQIYFEVKDYDFDEVVQDDLIDFEAINLDIPVGASINRTTYTGRFNNAQVELSFRVVCAENYYGPDCTQFCNDSSCPCNPGFTGEFCETNINDCEGVDCSGNGQCVDRINSFVCQCEPGFTGEFCESTIEENTGTTTSNSAIIGTVIGLAIPILGLSVVATVLTILLITTTRRRNNKEKRKMQESNDGHTRVTTRNNYDPQIPPQTNSDSVTRDTVRQLKELTQADSTNTEEERVFKNPIYGMTDENGYAIIQAQTGDGVGEDNSETETSTINGEDSGSGQEENSQNGPMYAACPLYAQSIP